VAAVLAAGLGAGQFKADKNSRLNSLYTALPSSLFLSSIVCFFIFSFLASSYDLLFSAKTVVDLVVAGWVAGSVIAFLYRIV
jgi:hypothetical protein